MHEPIPHDQIFCIDTQKIVLADFSASGYILDIGGGGEGIIGLLNPEQVVAIDIRKEELAEAPSGPLKIIMDATDLHFLDESFSTATSFFTLMFIKPADRLKVFQETYRVLQENGHFFIWDVIIPPRGEQHETFFAVPLQVIGDNRTIDTTYGVRWEKRTQDMTDIETLAAKTGFTITESRKNKNTFFFNLLK